MKAALTISSNNTTATRQQLSRVFVLLVVVLIAPASFAAIVSNTFFTANGVLATGSEAYSGALSDAALDNKVAGYFTGIGADALGGVSWDFSGKFTSGGSKDGTLPITVSPNLSGTGFEWSLDDPNDLGSFADAIFVVNNGTDYGFFYFQAMAETSGYIDTQSIFGGAGYSFVSVYTRGTSGADAGMGGGGAGSAGSGTSSGSGASVANAPEISVSGAPLAFGFLFFVLALLRERAGST